MADKTVHSRRSINARCDQARDEPLWKDCRDDYTVVTASSPRRCWLVSSASLGSPGLLTPSRHHHVPPGTAGASTPGAAEPGTSTRGLRRPHAEGRRAHLAMTPGGGALAPGPWGPDGACGQPGLRLPGRGLECAQRQGSGASAGGGQERGGSAPGGAAEGPQDSEAESTDVSAPTSSFTMVGSDPRPTPCLGS